MRPTIPFALVASLFVSHAWADGETSPMLGGAVVAGTSTESSTGMAGVELEAAWWWGRIGIAGELSGLSTVDGDGERSRVMIAGGSVRLRVLQRLMRSLLEPSDVELGIELQGIVERTVWERSDAQLDPVRRGFGVAVRLRGSTDDDVPRLITESRLFLRVLWSVPAGEQVLARSTTPPSARDIQDMTIIVGLGAAFGGGESQYLAQFHGRFEPMLVRP